MLHDQEVARQEEAARRAIQEEAHRKVMERKQAALQIRHNMLRTIAKSEVEQREIMRAHEERVAASAGPARARREAAIETKRNNVLKVLLDIDSDEFLNCMDDVVSQYGEVRCVTLEGVGHYHGGVVSIRCNRSHAHDAELESERLSLSRKAGLASLSAHQGNGANS